MWDCSEFWHFKIQVVQIQKFSSAEEFISELKKYIKYYNNDRIKANQ
ncbi:MAG: hypothetical protein EGP73_10625 [Alistipes indistinctus]|nr:hypothetical protein [Alistipes indistinctus]